MAVFLLGTAPLELQRRMVNDMVAGGKWHAIFLFSLIYVGLVLAEGLVKLVLNIYGSWISENAVRGLHQRIAKLATPEVGRRTDADNTADNDVRHDAKEIGETTLISTATQISSAAVSTGPIAVDQGVEASLILNEVEPVGGFIGTSVQQPLLQGGILVSVFGYLAYLNPIMALVGLGVFVPQLFFVPLMQWMINRRARTRITTLREIGGGVVAVKKGVRPAGTLATPASSMFTQSPGNAATLDQPASDQSVSDQSASDQSASDQSGRVDRIYQLNMSIYWLKFSMNFLMNLSYRLGVIGTLAVGGWFVIQGHTQLGTVMAFISGLARVNDPWGDIVDWFREMAVTRVKYAMIRDAADAFAGHSPQACR